MNKRMLLTLIMILVAASAGAFVGWKIHDMHIDMSLAASKC